jgi:serine phosphatase RsbU (regulator of sigma subunit)
MPKSKKTPLRRLLKPRDTTTLLAAFEELLNGYCLSVFDEDGKTIAGIPVPAPENILPLLEKSSDGKMAGWETGFLRPLLYEAQVRGGLAAQRNQSEGGTSSNHHVQQVLDLLNHTLSFVLKQATETRDIVDETVERYREINLLYQIGETIGTCLDPQKTPQLILQEARRCIKFDAGMVLLKDDVPVEQNGEVGQLGIVAVNGAPVQVKALRKNAIQIVEKVLQSRQAAITTSINALHNTTSYDGLFAAVLCAPIQVSDHILGAIVLGRMTEKPVFTAGDMKLLLALASQASIALETVRLHLEEVQKQRLEEELAISRQIQLSLLPDRPPTVSGWEFAAFYQAARQVGGDLYDFIHLPNQADKLGLVIADVAGKGIPAALFMAFCRTILHMQAMADNSPALVLEHTNQLILQSNRSGLFLTAFYAQLNLSNGEFEYANGGHDPLIWYRASHRQCQALTSHSYLLGYFPNFKTEERKIMIDPGDFLVFYTDGITEARDLDGNFFEEERLQSAIMAYKEASAQDVMQKIIDDTNGFIGDAQQSDDFTILVVKRTKENP